MLLSNFDRGKLNPFRTVSAQEDPVLTKHD